MADQDQVMNDRNRDLLMLLMGGGLMGATVGKGAGKGAGKIPRRGIISPEEETRQRAALGEAFDAATQREEMGNMKRGPQQGAPGVMPPPGPPPPGAGAPNPGGGDISNIMDQIKASVLGGLENKPNTSIPQSSLLRRWGDSVNENAPPPPGGAGQLGPPKVDDPTPASSFPPHTVLPNALRMAPPSSSPQSQAMEEALRRAQADEAAGFPPQRYPDEPPPSGRGGLPIPYSEQPNSNIGRNLAVGGAGAGGAALLASLLKGDSGDNAPAHPPTVMGSDQNTRPPGWDQGSGIRPPQPNRPPMVMGSSQNIMPPGWDPRTGIRPPQPNPQGIGMPDRVAQMGGPPQMDRPPFPGPIPMPPRQPPPHHKKQMQKGLPSGPISPFINGEIDNRDRRYQPPTEFGNPYR